VLPRCCAGPGLKPRWFRPVTWAWKARSSTVAQAFAFCKLEQRYAGEAPAPQEQQQIPCGIAQGGLKDGIRVVGAGEECIDPSVAHRSASQDDGRPQDDRWVGMTGLFPKSSQYSSPFPWGDSAIPGAKAPLV